MNPMTSMMANPSTTIAVVGATDEPGKYGGIIYRDLKSRGFDVLAVNPKRDTVDGDPAYPDLASLPKAPDIVDFVVPRWTGKRVAAEAIDLGYTNLWFQPGAEWPGLEDELATRGANPLVDACIMVVARTARAS